MKKCDIHQTCFMFCPEWKPRGLFIGGLWSTSTPLFFSRPPTPIFFFGGQVLPPPPLPATPWTSPHPGAFPFPFDRPWSRYKIPLHPSASHLFLFFFCLIYLFQLIGTTRGGVQGCGFLPDSRQPSIFLGHKMMPISERGLHCEFGGPLGGWVVNPPNNVQIMYSGV